MGHLLGQQFAVGIADLRDRHKSGEAVGQTDGEFIVTDLFYTAKEQHPLTERLGKSEKQQTMDILASQW